MSHPGSWFLVFPKSGIQEEVVLNPRVPQRLSFCKFSVASSCPQEEGMLFPTPYRKSSPPSSVCDLNDYRLKKRGLFRAILMMAVLSSQSRKRWRSWLYWEAQGKSGRLLLTPAPAAAWLLWCCLSQRLRAGRQGFLPCVAATPRAPSVQCAI